VNHFCNLENYFVGVDFFSFEDFFAAFPLCLVTKKANVTSRPTFVRFSLAFLLDDKQEKDRGQTY
jgi:hypothetical protein